MLPCISGNCMVSVFTCPKVKGCTQTAGAGRFVCTRCTGFAVRSVLSSCARPQAGPGCPQPYPVAAPLLCHCQPSSLPSQGPNSVFEVYLVGNNSNHFIISPTSIQGKADIRVRVAVPLDFETIPRYEFSVELHPCALWDIHIFKSDLRVTINQASLFLFLICTMKLQSITKWPKNGNNNKEGGGEEICSVPSLSFQHPKAQLQQLKQSVFPLAMSQGHKSFIEHKTLF